MASSRAVCVILAGRFSRSFAVGALNVALPLALGARGLSAAGIFAALSAGLAGAVLQTLAVGRLARRLPRQAVLALLTAAMSAACAVLAAAGGQLPVALLVGLLGGVCVQPNVAAQVPLEQATLADACSSKAEKTAIFGWYNAVSSAAISLGSFACGLPLPAALVGSGETQQEAAPLQVVAVSVVLGLVAVAYATLGIAGSTVGAADATLLDKKPDLTLTRCPHRGRIVGLASLFAVDSWAGGMVLQAVFTYWLSTQYGVSERAIGVLFGVGSVLGTGSYAVAVWLCNRIGPIPTMVFTHLPSNITMMLMPFMPNVALVYILFLTRACLCQMDVPPRDLFMMTVVNDDERVACSSTITLARAAACVLGPATGAAMWRSFGPSAPLIAGGFTKCVYDVILLVAFQSVGPVDGVKPGSAGPA